nr:hypothetical protein [Shewanella algidipiscicola]
MTRSKQGQPYRDKCCIVLGTSLIAVGVYVHNLSETIEAMGVNGIIISAIGVAIGMALSLSTKMYLTFVLVKRGSERNL